MRGILEGLMVQSHWDRASHTDKLILFAGPKRESSATMAEAKEEVLIDFFPTSNVFKERKLYFVHFQLYLSLFCVYEVEKQTFFLHRFLQHGCKKCDACTSVSWLLEAGLVHTVSGTDISTGNIPCEASENVHTPLPVHCLLQLLTVVHDYTIL